MQMVAQLMEEERRMSENSQEIEVVIDRNPAIHLNLLSALSSALRAEEDLNRQQMEQLIV